MSLSHSFIAAWLNEIHFSCFLAEVSFIKFDIEYLLI